jgi:hypothetical protein
MRRSSLKTISAHCSAGCSSLAICIRANNSKDSSGTKSDWREPLAF